MVDLFCYYVFNHLHHVFTAILLLYSVLCTETLVLGCVLLVYVCWYSPIKYNPGQSGVTGMQGVRVTVGQASSAVSGSARTALGTRMGSRVV
jgi:hypothetical protein